MWYFATFAAGVLRATAAKLTWISRAEQPQQERDIYRPATIDLRPRRTFSTNVDLNDIDPDIIVHRTCSYATNKPRNAEANALSAEQISHAAFVRWCIVRTRGFYSED